MPIQSNHGHGVSDAESGGRTPPLSCDCHAHVFGPHTRYPMVADRAYNPGEAPVAAYRRLLQGLGFGRAVLVQPSVYGLDNSCQLDALSVLGIEARAVVALDPAASAAAVEDLHRRGARGVRANLLVAGGPQWQDLLAVADRIAPLGWHLDVQLDLRQLATAQDAIERLALPVVIDHLACWRPHTPEEDTRILLDVLQCDNVWIKLSSIYRLSVAGPPYDDIAEIGARVIATAPDRILWGSDWPHLLHDGPRPDIGLVLERVMDWCGGDSARRRMLVDNPARLFGFEALAPGNRRRTSAGRQSAIENSTNTLEETQ